MADDRTTILEDEFGENQEYLNWPGLQYSTNVIDNKSIIPLNKWEENKEYLNWPGLQYLWYTKLKPAIYKSTSAVKGRIDDENWYITYDASTGEVYIALNEDSSTFYFDQDGSCGCIQEYNGMLQVVVNRDLSLRIDGFIDDNIGPIGNNSDQIGDATGKLYVNFDRNYEYAKESYDKTYGE